MRYSTRQLEHLAAIVEAGSISMAAKALGVTQPALTRSLSQLEARVGARLVNRSKGGSEPTPLGSALAVYGAGIINSARRAEMHVDDWRRSATGHLIVGASPSIAAYLMPSLIASFLRARPHVTIRVEVGPLAALKEMLLTSRIDMYIGVSNPGRYASDLSALPVYQDELGLYAREGHPLFEIKPLSLSTLCEYRWTAPLKGIFLRELIETTLNEVGLPYIDVAAETFSFDLQIALLRQTDFIAMLPKRIMEQHGEIICLDQADHLLPPRRFSILALRKLESETNPLAIRFIDDMVSLYKSNSETYYHPVS